MRFLYQTKEMRYDVRGHGPYILLLHGFLEDQTIWEAFVPSLAEKYTVVTIDLPGHGKSEVLEETHTMEFMALVVLDLLKKLGIEKVSIVGHSMGGYVALALAEQYPELVHQLILLNSRATSDNTQQRENRNRAIELVKKEPGLFIQMGIANLFSETAKHEFSEAIKELQKKALQFPVEGVLANIQGMRDRKDRTQVLKDFSKEKCILAGKEDPVIPISVSEAMAQACDCPLKILDGSHMGWLENKEEILTFLLLIDKI